MSKADRMMYKPNNCLTFSCRPISDSIWNNTKKKHDHILDLVITSEDEKFIRCVSVFHAVSLFPL